MANGAAGVARGDGLRPRCSRARFAETWRALALTACTLWSNLLLMVAPQHAVSPDAGLLARMV